ncbi:MAG TPA: glycosyltransferase family A protein [Gemmatimonadaceae bacterium]|nr:glycosyltransferase family A protein [Gemmatimonadaceae bacterium]
MRPGTHDPDHAGLRRADAVRGLVSVIVPAFNAEQWIAETLTSIRAQSYEPVETIVVDDGSGDATASIATASGAIVLRTQGGGPGGARNAGLAQARGEFIQFLDADDLLATGKIARQVAVLRASGADVAWEPFHELVLVASPPNAVFTVGRKHTPELGADLAASLLSARGFVQLGAMLVRRSPRTDAIWFEPGREVVEDIRYTVSLAMAGARFVSSESDELGLLYRQHAGARYSTRPIASFARGCAENAVWAQEYWEEHGGLTPPRRAALSEAYAFAARQLASTDRESFERVALRGQKFGREFTRHLPAKLRWLSRIVGYTRAESIASRWRRVRRRTRRRKRSSESS